MKRCKWVALLLLVPLVLTSCADILDLGFLTEPAPMEQYEEYFDGITPERGEIAVGTADLSNLDLEYSEREFGTDYDVGLATRIVFADSGSTVYGKGAETDGKDVVISAAGTYIVSGSAKGALLTVKASSEDEVRLVFSGLSLSAKVGTAIDIRSAASVLLTLVGENTISDSTEYKPSALDRGNTAVLLSAVPLCVNGLGSLSVAGNRSHGILSRDELVLTGGKLSVHTTKAGIVGEHCVKIGGGELYIVAEEEGTLSGVVLDQSNANPNYETPSDKPASGETGGDGSDGTGELGETSGYVYISGGFLDVYSTGDAIRAESLILVKDGKLDLVTGIRVDEVEEKEEAETAETLPDFWDIFNFEETEPEASEERAFEVYSDGLHASSDIIIWGGTLVIDASSHAIYSGGTVCVDGGWLLLRSVRDGLHALGSVGVSDGVLILEYSRHGMVGEDVHVSGGHIYIGKSVKGVVAKGMLGIWRGVLAVAGSEELPLDFGTGVATGGTLIALGNADSAREFFPFGSQGVILAHFSSRGEGYPLAICDEEGEFLLSLEGKCPYTVAYISSPDLQKGNVYTITSGGFAPKADRYGFATAGAQVIGAEPLIVVTANS